jgi:hypothetical protein
LADGVSIALENVATYFGPVTLRVQSRLKGAGVIEATLERHSERAPAVVEVRLPHPLGRRATSVTGGEYDPACETVSIPGSRKKSVITLQF